MKTFATAKKIFARFGRTQVRQSLVKNNRAHDVPFRSEHSQTSQSVFGSLWIGAHPRYISNWRKISRPYFLTLYVSSLFVLLRGEVEQLNRDRSPNQGKRNT